MNFELTEAQTSLQQAAIEFARTALGQEILERDRERLYRRSQPVRTRFGLLIRTVGDAASLRQDFSGIPGLLDDLGVPVIDLLDTFADLPDQNAFRVSSDNVHPNGPGHRRLFERLYNRLLGSPAWQMARPEKDTGPSAAQRSGRASSFGTAE